MGLVYHVFGDRSEQKGICLLGTTTRLYPAANSRRAGNKLFISAFIQIKGFAMGLSCLSF